jgi:deoxyribodipyrimidine photo-lyase
LAEKNISLIVRFDTPERVLPEVVRAHDITHIFCQLEWTSEECAVSDALKASLAGNVWHESHDQFLFHPSDIPFADFSHIPEVF